MKKKLKELVMGEVRAGYQFRGKVTAREDSNVSVIQIKDVDEHYFIHTSRLLKVRVDRPEGYLVQENDILFLSRGSRHYAAVLTTAVMNTIATGYFFILRPKTSVIEPRFLAWSINQPDFQEALRPFIRGTNIPIVSKTDFQGMIINVPPLLVQNRIMEIQTLLGREKQLSAAIQAKRQQLAQAISHQLITGQLTVEGN